MKKLMALLIVLLAITLPSCETQDAADLEPTTVQVDDVSSEGEGEEDPTGHGSGG